MVVPLIDLNVFVYPLSSDKHATYNVSLDYLCTCYQYIQVELPVPQVVNALSHVVRLVRTDADGRLQFEYLRGCG